MATRGVGAASDDAGGISNKGEPSPRFAYFGNRAMSEFRHYDQGAPPGWEERFVSQYATTHPWEDFAETWAHYLHIVDTLEMVQASGMSVSPLVDRTGDHTAAVNFDPYQDGSIEQLIGAWLPFVFAMNNVSRSMGEHDLYPFVIAPTVVQKLGFMHDLVHGRL